MRKPNLPIINHDSLLSTSLRSGLVNGWIFTQGGIIDLGKNEFELVWGEARRKSTKRLERWWNSPFRMLWRIYYRIKGEW